ncbi:MAG: imelysin family protein [Pseudomonadota bacterium]
MRLILTLLALMCFTPAHAQQPDLKAIVEQHILPGYAALASETAALDAAASPCRAKSAQLTTAYHNAFDAWVRVSHLRFGPAEVDDRAFSLAFWPDPRGATPKTLARLIRDADPVVEDASEFATVSVAGKGFYALEFLLYDPQFVEAEDKDYLCALIQAVTRDIAANAAAILADWRAGYGALIATPGNDTYRDAREAAQQVFTALATGLEFTAETRLARPLGTFDRPRPARAEARRSFRSLRHVVLSLDGTRDLALLISDNDETIVSTYAEALARAQELDDPVFASVAEPIGRIRVEALQSAVNAIRRTLARDIGPSLGVAQGFNALDGD